MRRRIRAGIVMFLFFCAAAPAFSAEAPSVKTAVWPKRATLGDEIFLFLRVSSREGFSVMPPSRDAKLSPFELKKVETLGPAAKNGRVVDTFKLTLTTFQLGELTVPSVPVDFGGSAGQGTLMSAPMKVEVVAVAKHPEKEDKLKPIKDPVSLDTRRIREAALGFLAAALAITLIVKVIRRRMRQTQADLESLKLPHERAVLELERLRRGNLLREGKTKEFYSELTDILRRYFARRYGVDTLEQTTAEITAALYGKGLEKTVINKAGTVFTNGDLVKFAKLVPDPALAAQLEKELLQVIELTKPEEPQPEEGKKK